jgi:transcriptional regulator with XRE-family HTH domain
MATPASRASAEPNSAVRQARTALGLSQRDLAERTGISLREIGSLDRGTALPQRSTALLLAAVLGCRPSDLRGGAGG